MIPSVSRVVHYVSEGSPPRPDGTQKYESKCRAAMITEVAEVGFNAEAEDNYDVTLFVMNPTGTFHRERCLYDDDHKPGTWHWPERVD